MTTGHPPTRRRSWREGLLRPAVGLLSIFALIAIVALALTLFQGGFSSGVPVTVVSQRAGLVMYPDARVKLRGVEVGRVSSIEERANGTAAIHLAMDPKQLDSIPGNARVAVVASTVFGAKFVELVDPPMPSQERMRAGQVIEAEHVTVEVNNVFDRLSAVMSTVEPGKLNATLGALSSAMSGRGGQIKQTITSLDSFLARLEPSLPTLSRDLQDAPGVLNTFADAAPDLLDALSAANTTSTTLVDKQGDLDSLLTSVIGLAEIGSEVLGCQSPAAHRPPAPFDTDNKSDQRVQPGVVLRRGGDPAYRQADSVKRTGSRGTRRLPLGCRAISISRQPSQDRRQRTAPVHRSPAAPLHGASSTCRHRHRSGSLGIQQRGCRARTRTDSSSSCSARRRPPAQHRADRPAGMMGLRGVALKFGAFATVMGMLTAVLFIVFGQHRAGSDTNAYSAVFSDVSDLEAGDSVRVSGVRVGTVDRVTLRADKTIVVDFDADRDIVLSAGTKAVVRYLNLTGDRFLELVPGIRLDDEASRGHADTDRPHRARAGPRRATRRLEAGDPGFESTRRQRLDVVADSDNAGTGWDGRITLLQEHLHSQRL